MRTLCPALVVLSLALGGCSTTQPTSSPPPASSSVPAGSDDTVERVVDGDTLVLTGTGRTRLIGVDTPESVGDRPVECHGPESASHTKELLPPGTQVRVVLDQEGRDRYDRTLAYVYRVEDGLFVNADLVSGGWAETLTIEPNTLHAQTFDQLEGEARTAGRGLWGSCR